MIIYFKSNDKFHTQHSSKMAISFIKSKLNSKHLACLESCLNMDNVSLCKFNWVFPMQLSATYHVINDNHALICSRNTCYSIVTPRNNYKLPNTKIHFLVQALFNALTNLLTYKT